ncbi:Histidinol-phosphatase [Mycobacterium talmoniae]|uniref:Histidinol-phosphatase n=1 Tax=Mycobacterium talmoniae TaxID=1858794 RepID=A0A2S8BJP2_9MYCO|nr:Histidinol-phosphatase [Mycobacterium talmoniae]
MMQDMTLALALADRADRLTLDRFGAQDLRVDTKPDLTPVTDADQSVEAALREVLAAERPDDSVVGEEFGGQTTFTGRQWIIDPIDGTKNFVRGVPVWASLIALLSDGVPVAGWSAPPPWAGGGGPGRDWARSGPSARRRPAGCRCRR